MTKTISFDIGSDSISSVIYDESKDTFDIIPTAFHFGNPFSTLHEIYTKNFTDDITKVAFTGSAGSFAGNLDLPYFFDTISVPTGIGYLSKDIKYVFHIGAKDPYFFEHNNISSKEETISFATDHGTGTKCGGGSGILISKQCKRYFEHKFDIEQGTNREAMQTRLENVFLDAGKSLKTATKNLNVGGRCGVVIQSDMIHLQNAGEHIQDILKGTYDRVIKNYVSDVLKTRTLDKKEKAVVTGGIFTEDGLLSMLEAELDMKIERHDWYRHVGAIGAAIKAKDQTGFLPPEKVLSLSEHEKSKVKFAAPLSDFVDKIKTYDEETVVAEKDDLKIFSDKATDAVIGLDGGSTTTKAIVLGLKDKEIIAEICLYTNGRPLQTAQEVFKQIHDHLSFANIKAIAFTGSSAAFYHRLFTNKDDTIDMIKDEITCHANGVKHYNSKVDTIFELGGQDAKFTVFNSDGTVKKSKMNLSCMAGTGQTMQNMVESIGLDIKTTFHEMALNAKRTPIVDDTCGIFTEAGIAKLIAMGFDKEEVAAAVVYGFMGGFVNKFIGSETFGDFASAQGGPFNGTSCLAALAAHTKMEVHAFPHRQLFGALGAAISLQKEIEDFDKEGTKWESSFIGLAQSQKEFTKETINCSELIKDTCGTKDCALQVFKNDGNLIYSGGACPKGNTNKINKKAPDYIKRYKGILNKHLKKLTTETEGAERILIPRSLTFLNEKGVFYTSFYKNLGFDVVVSPESNDEIASDGLQYAHSEVCYPVKVSFGHVSWLKKRMNEKTDKILCLNAIASNNYRFCPFVAGNGFLCKETLKVPNENALLPVIHFNDKTHDLAEGFHEDLQRVFPNRFTKKAVEKAIKTADSANDEFLEEVYTTGEKILEKIKDENIYLGVGRGYTIFDNMASSKVHELFVNNSLHFLPSFFMRPTDHAIDDIAHNMFWYQGRKIIRYSIDSAMTKEMYPIRETNFNCGVDSMLLYHETHIFETANKPHLVMQTDGHSSNAQFGTRIMANTEVVKKHTPTTIKLEELTIETPNESVKNKLIGVTTMGDNSKVLVAAIQAIGYQAELIPTNTDEALEYAKKHITTNACRPFNYQVGDIFAWINDKIKTHKQVNLAVLEPTAGGPCRFGQYAAIIRKMLNKNGFSGITMVSPSSEEDYQNMPFSKMQLFKLLKVVFKGACCNDILNDALLATRPYEKNKGDADKLYDRAQKLLFNLLAKRAGTRQLIRLMERMSKRFEEIKDDNAAKKPMILMNGEIFVRCHSGANQDSISLLESNGLEIKTASIYQWLEYTNLSFIETLEKNNKFLKAQMAKLKKNYMQKRARLFSKPFENILKIRENHSVYHTIETAKKALIFDPKIEGEAVMSIGEAHLFTKNKLDNISGIYHVAPFGCMQEICATMQINTQLHNDKPKEEVILPFMDAVFGDSELSNLEAEIAAFAEKCKLRFKLENK